MATPEIPFDIPADLDTPVAAFLKLEPLAPRFLLESVAGAEHQSRYSFLGFGEGLEVRLTGRTLAVGDSVAEAPREPDDLRGALRAALERAPHPGRGTDLPFRGGLVGVTGFDLARRLTRLPNQPPRSGDATEAAFFAPRSVLVFDHASRRAALLHDGPDAEREALQRAVRDALRSGVPERNGAGACDVPQATLGRERFVAGVERAQAAIRDGDVYQVVLSEGFAGRAELDPLQVYRALRLLNPSPYMFCLRFGATTVVGSSPEVLVRLEDGHATLRPIAGTRPRGVGRAADLVLENELLADPKEAAEHVMLVDLGRNDLGRVARPGTIRVTPSRAIERYSHVMHLVSGVEGELDPRHDQFDLFASAFPAGTVSGAPKVRALELIEEIEGERRGFYAGTAGYFGHGDTMDQAIAIRTLAFEDGRYAFRAGAGIVADSSPEREYAEVLAKAAVLAEALRIAREELR